MEEQEARKRMEESPLGQLLRPTVTSVRTHEELGKHSSTTLADAIQAMRERHQVGITYEATQDASD